MKAKDTLILGSITSLTDSQQKIVDRLLEKQAEVTWKAREPEIAEAHKAGYNEAVKNLKKPEILNIAETALSAQKAREECLGRLLD